MCPTYIMQFYKEDFEDYTRLQLHRDIVLHCKSRNIKLVNFESVLGLLKDVPVLTCTAERSFSSLRRLKSYLRSTMTQQRLNHIAVISCHSA